MGGKGLSHRNTQWLGPIPGMQVADRQGGETKPDLGTGVYKDRREWEELKAIYRRQKARSWELCLSTDVLSNSEKLLLFAGNVVETTRDNGLAFHLTEGPKETTDLCQDKTEHLQSRTRSTTDVQRAFLEGRSSFSLISTVIYPFLVIK